MKHPKLTEALQATTVFHDFSAQDVETFIDSCKARELQPSDILFSEGDKSDSVFFLISGYLEIFSCGVKIASLENQGVVGEMGVITGLPRTASVLAKTVSKLLWIEHSTLTAIINANPMMGMMLYRNVVKILSTYVRKSNQAHEVISQAEVDKMMGFE